MGKLAMPTILMKNGKVLEVPDDQMLSFLQENRDLIKDRYSPRKRPIKRSQSSELQSTSIE